MDRDDITFKTIGYTTFTVRVDRLRGAASPRENGKLKLRSNRLERVMLTRSVSYADAVANGLGQQLLNWHPESYPGYQKAYNAAYARFRGKVYEGSASLGVTLASAKQSADMIRSRYKMLNRRADSVLRDLEHSPPRLLAKRAAGAHLEVIFGWAPLLTDIHAAATSVIQKGVPPVFVSASHQERIMNKISVRDSGGWLSHNLTDEGVLRVKVGAQILIENPNTWLAERAGLLNPATVAWDLVPWSFVVNMFMNTGQLVQSLTDFSGLKLQNAYTSRTLSATRAISATYRPPPRYDGPHVNGGFDQQVVRSCFRDTSISLPSFQFKVPPLDISTVAMAASLFAQKFSRIQGFISGYVK